MKTSRGVVQRLSLFAGGLLICLPVGQAAPGGSGTAVGTAATSSGGHAAAGHGAVAAVGVGHPAMSAGGGFRPTGGASNGGFHPGPGSAVGFNHYPGGGYPTTSLNSIQRLGTLPSGTARTPSPVSSVNNAWTDPKNPHAGNNLYPGAYGYVPTQQANGRFQHGGNGLRGQHRYYYNNFPYAVYYPFLYNNYGYAGFGNLGYYGGGADVSGLTADNNVTDLGAPDFSNTPNNYYNYVAPEQDNANSSANAPAQPLPDAPAVGPQAPSSADKSSGASQGPDSLVEAVQDELARRGYFAGKADAIYSPATKEAIRRFQTDQHLPATGRINEATLHALRLD